MTLKCNSQFGNFAFAAEAEVSEAQRDVLASYGLLQVLQRVPSSKAEKALAGYDKKRPEGFKRTDIPFSTANASKLKGFLEEATIDVGEDEEQSLAIDVVVTEYVPTVAEPKWKAEKELFAKRKGEGRLDALAANVGYAGVHEENGEPAIAFLAAIKAKVAAIAKGL